MVVEERGLVGGSSAQPKRNGNTTTTPIFGYACIHQTALTLYKQYISDSLSYYRTECEKGPLEKKTYRFNATLLRR